MPSEAIQKAIVSVEQGIAAGLDVIRVLHKIDSVLNDGDATEYGVLVSLERARWHLSLFPRGGEGIELATTLSQGLGYVFRRELNGRTGTLYYKGMISDVDVCIFGDRDPACEIVQFKTIEPVAHYELRCPNAEVPS